MDLAEALDSAGVVVNDPKVLRNAHAQLKQFWQLYERESYTKALQATEEDPTYGVAWASSATRTTTSSSATRPVTCIEKAIELGVPANHKQYALKALKAAAQRARPPRRRRPGAAARAQDLAAEAVQAAVRAGGVGAGDQDGAARDQEDDQDRAAGATTR